MKTDLEKFMEHKKIMDTLIIEEYDDLLFELIEMKGGETR